MVSPCTESSGECSSHSEWKPVLQWPIRPMWWAGPAPLHFSDLVPYTSCPTGPITFPGACQHAPASWRSHLSFLECSSPGHVSLLPGSSQMSLSTSGHPWRHCVKWHSSPMFSTPALLFTGSFIIWHTGFLVLVLLSIRPFPTSTPYCTLSPTKLGPCQCDSHL